MFPKGTYKTITTLATSVALLVQCIACVAAACARTEKGFDVAPTRPCDHPSSSATSCRCASRASSSPSQCCHGMRKSCCSDAGNSDAVAQASRTSRQCGCRDHGDTCPVNCACGCRDRQGERPLPPHANTQRPGGEINWLAVTGNPIGFLTAQFGHTLHATTKLDLNQSVSLQVLYCIWRT